MCVCVCVFWYIKIKNLQKMNLINYLKAHIFAKESARWKFPFYLRYNITSLSSMNEYNGIYTRYRIYSDMEYTDTKYLLMKLFVYVCVCVYTQYILIHIYIVYIYIYIYVQANMYDCNVQWEIVKRKLLIIF